MKAKIKTDFFCNRCGRYHKYDVDNVDDFIGNFFHDIHGLFGYGSPFDNDLLKFSVCELCLFDILKDFKHPPKIDSDDLVKTFNMFRTKERSYYEDFFINNYKEIEELPKK